MKIKKKSRWTLYTKPYGPHKPVKPNKHLTRIEDEVAMLFIGNEFSLADLKIKSVDDLKNYYVCISTSPGYEDDDVNVSISVYKRTTKLEDNPSYDKEMLRYNEQMLKYEQAMKDHADEVKAWSAWCDQVKKEQLENDLKKAEALLKKHGKLQ